MTMENNCKITLCYKKRRNFISLFLLWREGVAAGGWRRRWRGERRLHGGRGRRNNDGDRRRQRRR